MLKDKVFSLFLNIIGVKAFFLEKNLEEIVFSIHSSKELIIR